MQPIKPKMDMWSKRPAVQIQNKMSKIVPQEDDKKLVTSSIMHRICVCPLYDLGMTFKSLLNLDNSI